MTAQTLLIARKHTTDNGSFRWTYGDIKKTAEFSTFYKGQDFITGKFYWVISGGTGTPEAEDYFSFGFTLPYEGNEAFVGIYDLSKGLTCTHAHSIPAPPGFEAFFTVDADSAILNIIRYDPGTGIVEGTFEALFKSRGYRLHPKGTFTLTQVPEKKGS